MEYVFCFVFLITFFLMRTEVLKVKLVLDLRSNLGYFGINLLLSLPCDPTEIPLRSSLDLYRRQPLICNHILFENLTCALPVEELISVQEPEER